MDKLATNAMRKVLNNIEMKGRVVIGEGEIDDFGKHRPLDIGKGLEYSDYRQVMSQSTLINHKNVKKFHNL